MSTKPNALRAAMLGVRQETAAPALSTVGAMPETVDRPALPPSRVGKRAVSGHFDPAVAKQLRMLAAESERKVQDLLEEALNDLFRKYNKSAIA